MEEISNKTKIILIILSIIPIAIIVFLTSLIIVNAEELNQSYTLNYDVTDTNTQHTIYNNNNGLLPNRRVYVAFNILIYKASTNTSFMVPPLRDVQIVASNNIYMCETNSFPIEYNFEDSYKGFYYNVICDVTTGTSGIKQIIATNDSYQSNSVRFVTSQYMTIRDNLQETINQTLTNASLAQQNILNTINTNIDNETLAIRQLMSGLNATLVTCVDNNTQYILNAINNQTTTITNIIQQMIENSMVCEEIDKNTLELEGKFLTNSGQVNNANGAGISKYIKITNKDKLKVLLTSQWNAICFYNVNKTLISCISNNTLNEGQYLNIPNNTSYFRYSMEIQSGKPTFQLCRYGNQAISDQQQEIIESDIDSQDKEQVDQTKYNDYKQKEETLLQSTQQADLSNLSIGIDSNTSSTIWQLITRIISSNNLIYGLFISILSIGIIKLALAR